MLMLQTIFLIVLHADLQTCIAVFIPKMNLPTYFIYLGIWQKNGMLLLYKIFWVVITADVYLRFKLILLYAALRSF